MLDMLTNVIYGEPDQYPDPGQCQDATLPKMYIVNKLPLVTINYLHRNNATLDKARDGLARGEPSECYWLLCKYS